MGISGELANFYNISSAASSSKRSVCVKYGFWSDWIRDLAAMTTFSSHRLVVGTLLKPSS